MSLPVGLRVTVNGGRGAGCRGPGGVARASPLADPITAAANEARRNDRRCDLLTMNDSAAIDDPNTQSIDDGSDLVSTLAHPGGQSMLDNPRNRYSQHEQCG